MAFVRLLKDLMKDKEIGHRFVPIIPDEARTFGMDSLFPTAKIYSPHGQKYDPVDRELLLSYREDQKGQILHEGISESGAMGSFIAAGSSYATHGEPMIPIYIFYSMFGWQRTGDAMWAAADQMTRGFLLGATAGRTTLMGEGLQHNDGHSHLIASTNPGFVSYDPGWAFEVAVIVKDALRRMYGSSEEHPNGEDISYYLTVYNEPIAQPPMPEHVTEEGILKGLYRFRPGPELERAPKAHLLASGVALPWALRAQQLLADDWGVSCDVWSATSWTELRRDALDAEEQALLHPDAEPRVPYVTQVLSDERGPFVAVSDWMKAVPDQISRWVPGDWFALGTDGFGRSDTRGATRRFFHVDAESSVLAVLTALVRRGELDKGVLSTAIDKYQLNDVAAAGAGETGGEN
jgi:pyruvate dehydrogenase E1 component